MFVRRLVLVMVAIALLLDNMLLTTVGNVMVLVLMNTEKEEKHLCSGCLLK